MSDRDAFAASIANLKFDHILELRLGSMVPVVVYNRPQPESHARRNGLGVGSDSSSIKQMVPYIVQCTGVTILSLKCAYFLKVTLL